MFEQFWTAWPKSQRKGGKATCQAKWVKLKLDLQADQIIKHVEWMKTTDQWRKDGGAYIPSPAVYLNQRRWDGAEIPEVKKTINILEKLAEDRARAVPMPADVKARLDALRGRR